MSSQTLVSTNRKISSEALTMTKQKYQQSTNPISHIQLFHPPIPNISSLWSAIAMAFWVRGPRHCAWNDPLVWRSWHLDLTGWRFQGIYETLTFHMFSYVFIISFHILSYLFICWFVVDLLICCFVLLLSLLLLLLDAMLKNRPKLKTPTSSLQGPEETRERVAILVLTDLTVEKMWKKTPKMWKSWFFIGFLWKPWSFPAGKPCKQLRFFMGI